MPLERRIHCNIVRLCQSWISQRLMRVKNRPRSQEAEDNVKGRPWDPREVKTAREKEIKYLCDMEVYEYSTEAEARAGTRRNPIPTKEVSKPHVTVRVWCVRRCVTKGSNRSSRQHLRWKLCESCSVLRARKMCFESRIPSLISIADVSRAHFFADAVRDVYVRLPDEDPKAKQPGVSGKLRKTMYGSLDAAQRWREHYAQVLETGGFSRGAAPPYHFFHLETYILVHGDCTEFAARCIRAEQSGNSGPRAVAVTNSEFLGQNTDAGNGDRKTPTPCERTGAKTNLDQTRLPLWKSHVW